jgi:hypothetical protein
LSTFWSIFFVYGIIIAYKCEFSDVVSLNNAGLDGSKRLSHLLDLSIGPVMGDVFDVNVVDQLSLGFLHIFWFEITHNKIFWLVLKCISC